MTDTFGDLTDRELLDKVKSGANVVFNRVVPMLDPVRDNGADAQELRNQIAELHRLLQACIIEGRRGRVSFETVDLGFNPNKDLQHACHGRIVRVRRDYPNKEEINLEISASATQAAFNLIIPHHNRRTLEDDRSFQTLKIGYRTRLLGLFEDVAPRRIETVLAKHDLEFGNTRFVQSPEKVFSALIDIVYSLRNALFHGSITPNEQHNEIYDPAYHIVMRLVRCTL